MRAREAQGLTELLVRARRADMQTKHVYDIILHIDYCMYQTKNKIEFYKLNFTKSCK